MDTISIISLVVGLMSFAYSIVIYKHTRKEQQANKDILDKIDNAIKEWHNKIMQFTIELIESQPTIIAKRSHSENSKAKQEIIYNLLERIKYIIEQPFSKEDSVAQTARLNTLLDTVTNISKSEIPPEVYTRLAEHQAKKQPEQSQAKPNHPKKG
jgi:hypothetical protein